MGFDFLNNDYTKAAASFGSNLGSGVLSTLGDAGKTAYDVVDQSTGGYLSSLTQPQYQDTSDINRKPTTSNPNLPSPASLFSSLGNTLNFNKLTNGLSSLNAPNVMGAMSNVGNTVVNTMSPFTMGAGSLTQNPTVINPPPKPTYVDNNQYPIASMLNPALPTITDASRLMTPYTESAMRSLTSTLSDSQPNRMVFDAVGNLVNYAGTGAQKLVNDATMVSQDLGETIVEGADATMGVLGDTGKTAGGIAKGVLWDAPYALGGYTGNIAATSGQLTMQQLEDVMGNARDLTVSKIKTDDGGTIVMWKPQAKPEIAKSYPMEKEAELFDKGSRYISDIPDQYKFKDIKTYNVTKGDISNNGASTYTYIPGQSQMLIKGLRFEGSPDDTESDKIVSSASGNKFDPGLKQELLNSNKMNDIASKYYYTQQQEAITKEKKKNNSITYRKKNRFIPNMMLINSINRMGRVNAQRANPLALQPKKKVKAQVKPVKKEKPFIFRQPDVAFKISTAMSGISNAIGGIESFVSIKPKKDVVNISNLTNNNSVLGNNSFKFNLDGLLYKPKKKILK